MNNQHELIDGVAETHRLAQFDVNLIFNTASSRYLVNKNVTVFLWFHGNLFVLLMLETL
jgi:hypothetical protein